MESEFRRSRGRPRKQTNVTEIRRARGRPKLELISDPHRYAIAAMEALRELYGLSEREAAIVAIRLMGTIANPETVRSKARIYWRRFLENEPEIRNFPRSGYQRFDEARKRNLCATDRWLANIGSAIYLSLVTENSDLIHRLMKIYELCRYVREAQCAKTVLTPILLYRPIVKSILHNTSYSYESCGIFPDLITQSD